MSARRFGTQSLVRLLGNWQETSSRTPLWRQLAEALRLLILDGRLTLQTRLPGERELAAWLSRLAPAEVLISGELHEERRPLALRHADDAILAAREARLSGHVSVGMAPSTASVPPWPAAHHQEIEVLIHV